jgi:ATP-binding cassette, subfamily F, member 3
VIEVSEIEKSFGAHVLFARASMRLGPRDRVALVGPNGSGKTTLLEMIAGLQSPDAGRVERRGRASVGYLPQETGHLGRRAVIDEVCASAPSAEAGQRMEELERQLERSDGGGRDEALATYVRVQDTFASLGGYTVEAKGERILSGLGFDIDDMLRPAADLSGGWRMRVALAKLLMAEPEVLLLDEPTNHLDVPSIRWLEDFMSRLEGAVLIVSHDRDFMNNIVGRVVAIEDRDLVAYSGNYDAYEVQREAVAMQREAAARNQAREVERIQAFIDRFRAKASKARQVQSRVKMLDRMDLVDAPAKRTKRMGVAFPSPPRSGRVVAELGSVGFAYGDNVVYEGLDLTLERGQKLALVGPNGAGKTTLLKLLAGELDPITGERRWGHNVSVGYFAQHTLEALDPSLRLTEEVERVLPSGSKVRPRDLLGRFLFSGDDANKRVRVLSGGERTRLALAKLLEPYRIRPLDLPAAVRLQLRAIELGLEAATEERVGSAE